MSHYLKECPICHRDCIVDGLCFDQLTYPSSTHFRPHGKSFGEFTDPRVRLYRDNKVVACLNCGVLWSKIDNIKLAKILSKKTNIEDVSRKGNNNKACLTCKGYRVTAGMLYGTKEYVKPIFRPRELRLFSLKRSDVVIENKGEFIACLDCGLVWAKIDNQLLREILIKRGTEKLKQRLALTM